jgi:membrane associated rhomboid family serine protease
MIPLRDRNRSETTPFINYLLIGACIVVFLYELSLGERQEAFFGRYAVLPRAVSLGVAGGGPILAAFLPLVTSMFLHGGWLHLLGNMLYLYIFGDNVEDRLGHGRYLCFYLLCGVGSAVAQVWSNPGSKIPLIGASGAIAGVLGAYLLLFPRARVLTLIPLVIFFPTIEVPAYVFLGFWFVLQFIQASASGGEGEAAGGVAWWAHAGGFVVGGVLLPVFLLGRRRVLMKGAEG